MSVINPLDQATYGPVNGQWVTYAEWQAYLTAQAELDAAKDTVTYLEPSPTPAKTPAASKIPGVVTLVPAATPVTTPKLQPHDFNFGGDSGSYCSIWWDDPLCSIWGGGNVFPSGPIGTGGTIIEQPIIISEGLSATEVNGAIDNALRSVWSAVVSSVDVALALAIGGIQRALTDLGNALKAAYAIAMRLAGFILNALTTMLRSVVKGILIALDDVRKILKSIYEDVLKPLASNLQKIRDKLMDIYQRFIRPVLIVLQDIRKVLAILVAFHVPGAAKLDKVLADLERRISAPFLLLLRYLNGVANWVNLIITAKYLLQRSVFLNSLKAYVGSATALQINNINRPPSPANYQAGLDSLHLNGPRGTKLEFDYYMLTGTGAMSSSIDDNNELFRKLLQDGLPL